jgi:hypothetical protein
MTTVGIFASVYERRNGKRGRRDAGTDDRDPVVHDHFLGYALRPIRRGGVVTDHKFDPASGHHITVPLHIELGTVDGRLANRAERTGQ